MSNIFTGDFYRMADELAAAMERVRVVWGEEIVSEIIESGALRRFSETLLMNRAIEFLTSFNK